MIYWNLGLCDSLTKTSIFAIINYMLHNSSCIPVKGGFRNMFKFKKITDFRLIYDYSQKVVTGIPYMFDADYETWLESYNNDVDYESEKMFRELITYAAFSENEIVGFIQFGIPEYICLGDEKNREEKYGIIRNLYFDIECGCEDGLISIAEDYFRERDIKTVFAFYHALGMTCFAGHGKLHLSMNYIDDSLKANGFAVEHENVYFGRLLSENDLENHKSVQVVFSETNPRGKRGFKIAVGGKAVGEGELIYLPQGGICYLKWIYVYEEFRCGGYASAALCVLFEELYRSGIRRFDTDTADVNEIACKLYKKAGFTDMGRTRSYVKQLDATPRKA